MRNTPVLIVIIKITNVRYSIHPRSASANSFLGLLCRGAAGWKGDVSEGAGCVSWGRVSGCVSYVGRSVQS